MRLFLIGWAENRPELVDAAQALREQGHEIVYWVRSSAVFAVDATLFPQTIFHELNDAVAARPAPALADMDIIPPGSDLLSRLGETESITLTMMNKRYDWMTVSERKHLYYSYVCYWSSVLERFRPEVIVFSMIPHTLYNFVIYGLAKVWGIPTVMLDMTLVKNRLLFMNKFEEGSAALARELETAQTKTFSLTDLPSDLKDYFEKQTDTQSADTPPVYVQNELKNYSFRKKIVLKIKIVYTSLRDRTFFTKTFQFIAKLFRPNLADEYNKVCTVPDLNKKFVYVPLQYQPECTTSPLGGLYVDQILMIETLAAALPPDWVIYVKEHPIQWLPRGTNFVGARYRGYYEAIAHIKNVKIVPLATSGFTLIHRSQAVATVTGTTGWEAILRLKPTLIFGYPWYQHCPGLFRVRDTQSCRVAFEQIEKGFALKHSDTLRFLCAFSKVSVHGFIDDYGRATSALTTEENKRAITDSLLEEIAALEVRL